MSILYIGLVKEDSLDPLGEVDYMVRPLFRTMKCLDKHSRSAEGKCMVFVDEFGWVYQNFSAFMSETLYPAMCIVTPVLGVFSRNNDGRVRLFSFKAPKTAKEIKIEKWANIGMTVGGLGSAAVLGAAAVFPVTAPFVWGAIGVGALVGTVSGSLSAGKLWKRNKHEQSISLGDKESRAHWLAITGTLVGFAASGAASALRSAAVAGNVSKGLIYTTNSIFGASIFINGACVGNSIWEMTESRDVTTGDILQLSVSLFLFTHSVYNYQTARTIVQETQTLHIKDYKQTLSKNGQKRFQRKLNGRMREQGVTKGTGDTIRNLNTAEHYNNNFKGTGAYQTSAGVAENEKLRETLSNSFTRFELGPESLGTLVTIYTVIVKTGSPEVFELLRKMAELIFKRYLTTATLRIEDIISDCYQVLSKFAESRRMPIQDVLLVFDGLTFETIPSVVKEWFEAYVPQLGDKCCPECQGMRYEVWGSRDSGTYQNATFLCKY